MNCTAKFADGKVEIWVASQNGDASLAAAAEAAGVKLADVKVNKLHLGGGFGRRGQQDYTRQAVLIAKQVPGRPVKLIWSREEDTQHDFYRPITQCKLTAGLDARRQRDRACMRACPGSRSWPTSRRSAWRTASIASRSRAGPRRSSATARSRTC